MTTGFLETDLVRDEGRENVAYLDTRRNVTWGIGHMDNKVHVGTHFTDAQIDSQFLIDKAIAQRGLAQHWPPLNTLSDLRQDAMINMAFNLGVSKLLTFHTFLDYMTQGKYGSAALDLHGTPWYHEVGDRAKRICAQITTNIHQE